MAEINKGVFSSFEAAMAKIKENHSKISKYETPWWGDKETEGELINNRSYVIRFKDVKDTENSEKKDIAQQRLDYDKVKYLHINWTHQIKGVDTVKECYQISTPRPEFILCDYYVSWTKSRIGDIPPDIKERLDKGGVKKWSGRYWGGEAGRYSRRR